MRVKRAWLRHPLRRSLTALPVMERESQSFAEAQLRQLREHYALEVLRLAQPRPIFAHLASLPAGPVPIAVTPAYGILQ